MPGRSRIPQLGPIIVAPDWQPPQATRKRRHGTGEPVVLMGVEGPDVYAWERDIVLEPVQDAAEPLTPAEHEAFRAPRLKPPSEQELLNLPSSTGWLPSDCVELSHDKTLATNHFRENERTTLISRDWVHAQHPNGGKATWRARATRATNAWGDIHFGLTEASSFDQPGRTVVFDCRGNFRVGFHPLNLVRMHDCEDLDAVDGASQSWLNWPAVHKNQVTQVTVDLQGEYMEVHLGQAGYLRYPLVGWTTARLCATFSVWGDELKVDAGPGGE